MDFFSRLSLGWNIAKNSFKVLRANKQLILFPVFSGIAMLFILLSFVLAIFAAAGWDVEIVQTGDNSSYYLYLFLFYYVSNFIVIFFNVALIHCTHLYFKGEQPTLSAGIQFSFKRIKAILAWSFFAGTVGWLLKLIQENSGIVGKIITALLGMIWGIATFFVLPVIAYESGDPIKAFKRSALIMKEKWGESIGAGFNFGIFKFIAFTLIGVPAFLLGYFIHPVVGVVFVVPCILLIVAIFSAAETIFVSAIYHKINGDPVEQFNDQLVENLFVTKKVGLFNR
jgi:hypothetical protein